MSGPVVRGNLCINAHPVGCASLVRRQIEYARRRAPLARPPHTVLVVGASMGYGLACRIEAAFGGHAATLGVSFERPAGDRKSGTPGWYNNRAFDKAAAQAGLPALSIEADAFADATKEQTVAALRAWDRPVDLVIYSLASPVRTDPVDGLSYRSAIKPVGAAYSGTTIDPLTGRLSSLAIEPATEEEIRATVKVMGGEDWQRWLACLQEAGVLAPGVRTVAFSYIGPAFTRAIYRSGTLGFAKAHLEATAASLTRQLAPLGGLAQVSVNKALVTRASAVIPGMPLYIAALYRVMKDHRLHEGCGEQAARLFRASLYGEHPAPLDEAGRIRLDDWEMRDDVQAEVAALLAAVRQETLWQQVDVEGYRHDFFALNGFHAPPPPATP